MAKLAELVPHLTVAELHQRFRDCGNAAEKIHWQAIWLRAQGRSTSEVAAVCGYKRDWVHQLVRRYNARGPDALGDGRRGSKLMSDAQLDELQHAVLSGNPPGGGLWTGPKVAAWMTAKLHRPVSPQLAWEYLQHIGFSKQTPRPRHSRASAAAQAAWTSGEHVRVEEHRWFIKAEGLAEVMSEQRGARREQDHASAYLEAARNIAGPTARACPPLPEYS